jgi:hypothetical protein
MAAAEDLDLRARTSMKLPNFVIVGAAKCGTTSLHEYLAEHPEVYLPTRKELHYFSFAAISRNSGGPGDRGFLRYFCADREQYESHYQAVRDETAIGEVSPSYFHYAEVSERLRDELHHPRIVVILRDPLQRTFSQYMHLVRDNRETLGFADALVAERERTSQGWGALWRYAESSLYAARLRRYLETFPADRVKVLIFEDLRRDAARVLRDLWRFLEVDDSVVPNTSEVYNASGRPKSRLIADLIAKPNLLASAARRVVPERSRSWIKNRLRRINTGPKGEIDDWSRGYLRDYFAEDVKEVEAILERDLDWLA